MRDEVQSHEFSKIMNGMEGNLLRQAHNFYKGKSKRSRFFGWQYNLIIYVNVIAELFGSACFVILAFMQGYTTSFVHALH